MEQERAAQRTREKASVPMTDISNIDVPEGTDELSRNTRRAWRDRLNSASSRKMITGVLATLVGGSFWGFSGTSASFLFDTYHVDTLWLMSVRQILAGLLFMAVVVTRDRERLIKLWTTPADRKQLLLFTAFGLLFNQFCYLSAVRLTNAGTATVLQCLQLVIIMGYACVTDRRMPRTREVIGIGLALGGTFLIATGGDPTSLNISAWPGSRSYVCGQRRVYGGDSRQDPARIRQPHRHGLGNAHGGRGLVCLGAALGAYAGARRCRHRGARGIRGYRLVFCLHALHAGR